MPVADSSDGSTDRTPSETGQTLDLSLTFRQVAITSFLVGMLFGGFAMAAVSSPLTGLIAGGDDTPTTPTDDPTDTGGSDTGALDTTKISLDGEPVLGEDDAAVTLVMYEDYQCPFCRRFETGEVQGPDNPSTKGAYEKIVENYVDTGKVKIVWKDFPIPQLGHDWAEPAATAMECVYRQDNDAFWAVKDKVFRNKPQLSKSNIQGKIKTWAAEEGVSSTAVQECIANGDPMQEVTEDRNEGGTFDVTVGPRNSPFVSGTPSFVIYETGSDQGEPIVGSQPYSRFKSVIESKLS